MKFKDASTVLFTVFPSIFCSTTCVVGAPGLLTTSTSIMDDGNSQDFRARVPSSTLPLVTSSLCSSFLSSREQRWLFSSQLCGYLNIPVPRYHTASSIASILSSTTCATISTLFGSNVIALYVERNLVGWDSGAYPCSRISIHSYITVLHLYSMKG